MNRLCGSPTPFGLPHSPVLQGPASLIQWECAGGCTAFDCSTVRATSASRHSGAVEKKGRPPLPNSSAATYAMASLHNEQCVHRKFLHTRSLDLALCTHCKLVSQFVFSVFFILFFGNFKVSSGNNVPPFGARILQRIVVQLPAV